MDAGKILLIESDRHIAKYLSQRVFNSLGYSVSVIPGVQQALFEIQIQQPDIIVSRLNLEGLSGKDLLVALQSQGIDTPVIVLAEMGKEKDVIQAFRLGAADCIFFPLREAEIVAAIDRTRSDRKFENIARQERARLSGTINKVGEGILFADNAGQIYLVNRFAEKLFRKADTQLIGNSIAKILDIDPNSGIFANKNGMHEYSSELQLGEGALYKVDIQSLGEDGYITVVSNADNSNSDSRRTEFLNSLSHDLRSPLTAILGYVELVKRAGSLNDKQDHFVDRIRQGVRNITSLINDLLDLGYIEDGLDEKREIVPIQEILHISLDGLQNQIETKKHEIALNMPDEPVFIKADRYRIRQLFDNVIGNAIKYTPDRGRITIRVKQVDDTMFVKVSDNGKGIPPGDQPYVFDKFFRGSNLSTDSEGTGLGMAIVKSIVDNHDGEIWLDSKVDQGTTFTISFPTASD